MRSIKELPINERLMEKLLNKEAKMLSDQELLAITLLRKKENCNRDYNICKEGVNFEE